VRLLRLNEGLYEQVINKLFESKFQELQSIYAINREKIDEEESSDIFAAYLQKIIKKVFNQLKKKDILINQRDLSNKLIEFLITHTKDENLRKYLITTETELLLSILHKTINNQDLQKHPIRPQSPLSKSFIFTGAEQEPSLYNELKKEIISANQIDILMSFIRWSGVRMLMKELEQFTKNPNHRLRIITTTYIGATEVKAIDYLAQLPNTSIKISYNTQRTRLHAKA